MTLYHDLLGKPDVDVSATFKAKEMGLSHDDLICFRNGDMLLIDQSGCGNHWRGTLTHQPPRLLQRGAALRQSHPDRPFLTHIRGYGWALLKSVGVETASGIGPGLEFWHLDGTPATPEERALWLTPQRT